MNIEKLSTDFANGIENSDHKQKLLAMHSYRVGANDLLTEIKTFIIANPKATASQIIQFIENA